MQYINIKSLFVFSILAGVNVVNPPIGPVYTNFTRVIIAAPLNYRQHMKAKPDILIY